MNRRLISNRNQFEPGNPGGGRPLGSRNRLTEVALQALREHFAEFGKTAIDRVYLEETGDISEDRRFALPA